MKTLTATAANQLTDPIYVSRHGLLGLSVSGTFVGTIAVQRLPEENSGNTPPTPGDTGWEDYLTKTAAYAGSLADLAPGWYRLKCTAYTSGTAVAKLW